MTAKSRTRPLMNQDKSELEEQACQQSQVQALINTDKRKYMGFWISELRTFYRAFKTPANWRKHCEFRSEQIFTENDGI